MPVSTLRSETAKVVRLAGGDVARIFRLIGSGVSPQDALHDLLPAVVSEYGALGAALAAEWYDEERERAEVRGRFAAVPVAADDRGAHALVGWAVAGATDDATLRTLITGGVQRRVADHARYTVASSAVADSQAAGWMRVGGGSSCKFCAMLLGRGAVYSEAGASFESHDHCNCSAAPAWR